MIFSKWWKRCSGPVLAGLILVLSAVAPVRAAWPEALSGCRVFDRENEQAARVVFAAGPMLAARRLGASGGDAVLPDSPLVDAGRLQLTVYDCDKQQTAFGLGSDLRRQLRSTGWTLNFTCDGESCGPSQGWQQLLPELRVQPPQDSYSYTLATRYTSSGVIRLASFAVDIDDRPRVLVQRLQASPEQSIKQELDLAVVQDLYARYQPLQSVHFATASSRVPDTAHASLAALPGPAADWVVVGHSDLRGTEAVNGLLSWRRARQVADLMVRSGVPEANIRIYSVAALLPTASEKLDENRRVDIFRMPVTRMEFDKQALSAGPALVSAWGGRN